MPDEALVVTVAGTRQLNFAAPPMQWTGWLALVWMFGALLMLTRAGIQVAGAERLRRCGEPLANVRIAQLLAEAQRAVRLTRKVRVTVTRTLTSPAVVGVLVPTLILPLSLVTTLTHEQLRFVLLHELAHIRRGDYFANLFQLFVEALLFFNPAVWWISQQVRREREACCDALAIELSGAPVAYARTLVHVAESALHPSPVAAATFGNKQREPSSLSDRVQRLLVPGYRPALRLTWRAMLLSLLVGGTLLVLSALGTRTTVGAVLADAKRPKAETDVSDTNPRTNPHAIDGDGDRQVQGAASTNKTASGTSAPEESAEKLYTLKFEVSPTKFSRMIGITNRSDGLPYITQAVTNDEGVRYLIRTNSMEAAHRAMRTLFAEAGVDLQPPKAVFFNDRIGVLFVRATQMEVHRIAEVMALFTENGQVDYNGTNVNMLVQSARLLLELGKRDEAETKLKTALDMDPKNRAAAHYLGLVSKSDEQGHQSQPDVSESRRPQHPVTQTNVIAVPPQIKIEARFVEFSTKVDSRVLNFDWPSGNKQLNTRSTNAPDQARSSYHGILTDPQYRVVLRALEQRSGVDLLSAPAVTILSGRQSQIQITEPQTAGPGANPKVPAPIRLALDLISSVSADGNTIQMTLLPTIGHDESGKDAPIHNSLSPPGTNSPLPLPRTRLVQVTSSAVVRDGQTMVLDLTSEPESNDKLNQRKRSIIFVTPRLIDAAGNPLHSDAELQSGENTVLPQPVDNPTLVPAKAGSSAVVPPSGGSSGLPERHGNVLSGGKSPPQILIEAKFIELADFDPVTEPADSPLRNLSTAITTNSTATKTASKAAADFRAKFGPTNNLILETVSPATVTQLLTKDQAEALVTGLIKRSGVDILSAPKASTADGRAAEIQVTDLRTIVTAVETNLTVNADGKQQGGINYLTEAIPFGSVLNVVPSLDAADDGKINLTILAHDTEFIGYDDPGHFVPSVVSAPGALPIKGVLPLPRARLRELNAPASIQDGQSILLSGPVSVNVTRVKNKVPVLGDIPLLGKLFRSTKTSTVKKHLLVLVKASLVDDKGAPFRKPNPATQNPNPIQWDAPALLR